MIRNYFKIAWRNLWRNKGFSITNIFGLTIGLTTCLFITFFVKDELSYDRYNEKVDRIYRVNTHISINGSGFNGINSPAPLGPTMLNDYPHVEKAVRIRGNGTILVKKGNETLVEQDATFADSTLFEVFTLPMIAGNPKTALNQPYSLVLSESMAKKYFHTVDVIGETLLINNTTTYKITGVIKDMPAQSSFHFNFIRAMSELPNSRSDSWLSNNYVTFLLVRPGTTQQMLNDDLKQATIKYVGPKLQSMIHSSLTDITKKGGYFFYDAMPLGRIHLYSTLTNEMEPNGNIQYVYIFIVIAAFILLLACVNFMNLSTARSAGRVKEIGIRKALGSQRSALVFQFLIESVLTSFIALLFSLAATSLLLPFFNQLSGKEIQLDLWSSPWMLPLLLLGALIVGVLAGSYPAFILSSFKPVKVLKGKLTLGFKNNGFRNGMIVFQFATAVVLIVGTLVIYSQLNYIQNKNLGYKREEVLVLKNMYSMGPHVQSFKNEVLNIPGVQAASLGSTFPTSEIYNTNAFSKNASLSADKTLVLGQWRVDADYIPSLGMEIIKGRNFSANRPADSTALIINETAARLLGFNEPLDKILYEGIGSTTAYHIIGVVKDFNTGSLRNETPPIAFNLAERAGMMALRISTENISETISRIKDTYHSISNMAEQPFSYSFMDQDFNNLYHSEQRTGKIFIYFTFFAIFIACLGLFGLITYAAEQRTREIGIRKVLGASVSGIVVLLSKDFIKLVLVAIVIATPIAWYAMNNWLQDFAYRIEIQWWMFALSGLLAVVIALLTVSFQSVKAALMNPVKSLRSE